MAFARRRGVSRRAFKKLINERVLQKIANLVTTTRQQFEIFSFFIFFVDNVWTSDYID